MNTKDLVNTILGVSVTNLNTKRYGDVYDVLNNQTVTYTALVVEVMRSEELAHSRNITLRLTVIDKLNEDESNTLDVFDHTEKVLHDLLISLPDSVDWEGEYSIEYVKQDFADKCAGCYSEITFITDKNLCEYYE